MSKTPASLTHSHQRGAAAVEGLLVITFLVMLWIGLNHLGQAYVLAQRTRAVARGCAFHLASNNCSSVPSFCQVSMQQDTSDSTPGTDKLTRVGDPGDGEQGEQKYRDATNAEVESQVNNGLFQRAETTAQAELERPALLGGGTTNLSQTFSLPCNPKPGTLMDKAKDLFLQFFGLATPEVDDDEQDHED